MSNFLQIKEDNLSRAWAKIFQAILNGAGSEQGPIVVEINGFESGKIEEIEEIRTVLDTKLLEDGKSSCETVAGTIFPFSLWNPNLSREELFKRYKKILPIVRKCPANNKGVYFERLIAYGSPKGGIKEEGTVNQLEHIINTYKNKGNHRRSALQAAIFNPYVDHTDQRQLGFPCLQQVAFIPEGEELVVTGFYPMQLLYEKAYGNYLGLCRLGIFMAQEMGLTFKGLRCVITVGQIDIPKRDLQELDSEINQILESNSENCEVK